MAHQGTSDRIAEPFSFAALQGRLRAALIAACGVMTAWLRHRADQRYLATLSEHYLKDLGLSRPPEEPRSSRPFWYP